MITNENILDKVEEYILNRPSVGLGKYLCQRLGVCNTYIAGLTDIEVMDYLFGAGRPRTFGRRKYD